MATDSQSGEESRREGEKDGQSESRHGEKITELKKKSLSEVALSVVRDSVELGKALGGGRKSRPARQSLAPAIIFVASQNLYRAFR